MSDSWKLIDGFVSQGSLTWQWITAVCSGAKAYLTTPGIWCTTQAQFPENIFTILLPICLERIIGTVIKCFSIVSTEDRKPITQILKGWGLLQKCRIMFPRVIATITKVAYSANISVSTCLMFSTCSLWCPYWHSWVPFYKTNFYQLDTAVAMQQHCGNLILKLHTLPDPYSTSLKQAHTNYALRNRIKSSYLCKSACVYNLDNH